MIRLNMLKNTVGRKVAGVTSRLRGALDGFDPVFYRARYADLAHLSEKALQRHYIDYGRREGRHGSPMAAIAALEGQVGPAPDDFDLHVYRALNPDLAQSLVHDWEFTLHFLEAGREAGRPYHARGLGRPWEPLFHYADFVACASGWLKKRPANRQEALDIFEKDGINRLAPINLEWIFDPDFYRKKYGASARQADSELYRQWLLTGLPAGRHPNETQELNALLGGRRFPNCFDWREYRSATPPAVAARLADKIDALRHFFDFGFGEGLFAAISGEDAGDLYEAIGDYHLVRGGFVVARRAYDNAIACGQTRSTVYHRRGDAALGLGDKSAAASDFHEAIRHGGASVWSYIHSATIAADHALFEDAFRFLRQGYPTWRRRAEFIRTIDTTIERLFHQASSQAKLLYSVGERVSADALMERTLQQMRRVIEELTPFPPPAANAGDGPVAFFASQELRQCKHYRVEQKVRVLRSAGVDVRLVDQFDPNPLAALIGARAAIFYRVPAFPGIVKTILTARALGLPTYYDIDDLIFDPAHFPPSFESYENQITSDDYAGLLYGVPLFRHAMSLCDYGVTSTNELVPHIEPLVREKQCLVLRNGLDQRNDRWVAEGAAPRPTRAMTSIFYGSGTKAHNADFNRLAAPALLDLMRSRPDLRLVIAGHLELREEFEALRSRVLRVGFIDNIDALWAILAACDINLAVLEPDGFNDCKSEIKWLEAAVLQIPTIASGTKMHRETFRDGDDILIADTPDEWRRALTRLIDDPGLRARIGAAARRTALANYALEPCAKRFAEALDKRQKPRVPLERPRKLRALLCHVFFYPQSVGGATRVIQDAVDALLAGHPEVELAIFSTQDGATPAGRVEFDTYRGVPVYKIATPIEANMDWRPFNPDTVDAFAKVVDAFQPDVIHFHCIQRLTGSIVELAKQRDIPYLVTLHDGWWISDQQFFVDEDGVLALPADDPLKTPRAGVSLGDSLLRRQRLLELLNGAAAAISVSHSFAKLYEAAGCRNLTVIENGVARKATVEPRATGGDSRLTLGHIGGRSTHKGATLLEAALRCGNFPNLRLVMIDATLENGARRQTIWGATPVELWGHTPMAEVGKLYASLDVLVAPSIWPESFGLVTREAQLHGLWVIASDRGAIGEDVEHGRNGFVIDVSDPQALTKLLAEMDQNVARFKQPPPAPTRAPFTVEEQTAKLVELYRTVARRERKTPLALLRGGLDDGDKLAG